MVPYYGFSQILSIHSLPSAEVHPRVADQQDLNLVLVTNVNCVIFVTCVGRAPVTYNKWDKLCHICHTDVYDLSHMSHKDV